MASKMKAVVYEKPCNALDLRIIPWRKPSPKKGEVLVEVRAFGLNFAEICKYTEHLLTWFIHTHSCHTAARKGEYRDAPPFPFVPGYECAGNISELGEDVEGFTIGDRVVCFCDFGAYAEFVSVRKEGCIRIPDSVSYETAASFPVQYCTALHCLFGL